MMLSISSPYERGEGEGEGEDEGGY